MLKPTLYTTLTKNQVRFFWRDMSNNYLAHSLDWEPWTGIDPIPVGRTIAIRLHKDNGGVNCINDWEIQFGQTFKVNNGASKSMIINGHFYFDMKFWLDKGAEWADITFVFDGDHDET